MAQREVVGRFAPSPSGRLHLGNLFCSLLAWLSAKQQGGRILLRIEDLDPARSKREYTDQLQRDLDFLGLDWDEGGCGAAGPHAPYEQSLRGPFYEQILSRLRRQGLVYPCFCSRAQLHAASAPHAADGEVVYPGTCRNLSEEEIRRRILLRDPALRLIVPDEEISFFDRHYGRCSQNLARECGDFILRRSDGVFAYQLAVVADDAAMGVTEVVRGRDLLSSTPRQLYLYRLLGAAPPSFCHLPLLLAPDGRRLSKRDADLGLDALRARGFTAAGITGALAYTAGLLERPVPATPRQLLPLFRWDKIPKEDIPLPAGLFDGPPF